jgi:hypothetical protein
MGAPAPAWIGGCWLLLFVALLQTHSAGGYSANAIPRASRPVQDIRSVDDLVEGLAALGSGSMLLWEAQSTDRPEWRGAADNLVSGRATNFDLDYSINGGCEDDCSGGCEEVRSAVDLIPVESRCDDLRAMLSDMDTLTQAMRSAALPGERVQCRLALMDGVRCPKWHEDYVNLRLIKSYYGVGSDWAAPDDWSVRAVNSARSALEQDPTVAPDKVQHAQCGDVLVIAGRKREGSVPVLHRSPVSPVSSVSVSPVPVSSGGGKRLLFTVTLTG